ncbi:hypothetical protein, partial [Bacillus altitudinis]|uniref:hypothetical protein n=1 Tax=Bacillus altitudinis TaxID=293387 RepID=UPI003B52D03A
DGGKKIVEKGVMGGGGRMGGKKGGEVRRGKSGVEVCRLAGKVGECCCKDAWMCEVYMVEGECGGGCGKEGGDGDLEGMLRLRGKMVKVEKGGVDKTSSKNEVR